MWLLLDAAYEQDIAVSLWDGSSEPLFEIYTRSKISFFEFIEQKVRKLGGFKKIAGILIKPGPGGFSNVRTAVIAANTLAFAIGAQIYKIDYNKGADEKLFKQIIKNKSKNILDLIKPIYDRELNITLRKSKY